ncbi:MAG: hypothetical protein JNM84_00150 [Planctomycetes bacterium]|nr:hypothetical protein [Planctomycetota bacterium]
MLRPATLLLGATALLACDRALSAQERLELYVERYGARELAEVRAIDALWPGERMRKVDEASFRATWSARLGPEQELEPLAEIFRRLQALEYGIVARVGEREALERLRPVPRSGPRPYAPRGPLPEALLVESEPNDAPASANALNCGDVMQGALLGVQDLDVFQVVTATPQRFVARVDPDPTSAQPLADASLELLDANGRTLAFNDDTNGLYPELDLLLPSGVWYFRVAAASFALNGAYLFSPGCLALPVLSAASPLPVSLAAQERAAFLFDLAQGDELRLAATPLAPPSGELELELWGRDGLQLLATSRVGASRGEAAIRTALPPGQYFARVRALDANPIALQLALALRGTGIPIQSCSGGQVRFDVGGEANPAFLWQPAGVVFGTLLAKETGWPHATRVHLDDARGGLLRSAELLPEGIGELGATIGNGTYVGLAARNAGLPSVSWRDSAIAQRWSRPQPSGGTYAGPTDLQVSTLQGFGFLDEHLSASGVLTARLFTEFDVDAGGWDLAWFVDRCFAEVDGPTGRQSFSPSAVRWLPGTNAGWAASNLLGGPAELAADDGLYLAANLADSAQDARELCALELDFDLAALGVSGSQLTALRFFAEWYFAGNATITGASAPPSFDDSSEEANVFARRVELRRQTSGTWDALGDVMPFEDRVELTLACHPIPQSSASAADEATAALDPATPAHGFLLEAGSPLALRASAAPRSPTAWRGSNTAALWRAPSAQHPGPIRAALAGPLPGGAVGPQGQLLLRLRWEACWDESIWDAHHYYDFAQLDLDLGASAVQITAKDLRLGPDAARFRGPSGVSFQSTAAVDLGANDGIYARARREDYDTPAHGPSAEHWDLLEFDVSTLLPPGGGSAIQALDAEVELYRNGAGAQPTPGNAGGSEELLLRSDLALELFDHATQTWVPLSSGPILRGYPFAPVCAPIGTVDPELLAFDLASGLSLGRDDDAGGGFDARLELAVGDPATGRSSTLLVAALSPLAGANDRGRIGLAVEAPFGYAGHAPFELRLGSPLVVELRGPEGWLAIGWHSYLPHLPSGVALPSLAQGFLVLDLTAFFLALPNAQPIVGGRATGSLPTPADPFLAGAQIFGQGLLFDPATVTIHLGNEDRVTLVF